MSIPGDTLTSLSRLSNRRKVKSAGNPEDPFVPDLEGAGGEGFPAIPEVPPEGLMSNPAQSLDPRANDIIDTSDQGMMGADSSQNPTDLYQLGSNLANMMGPQQPQGPMQETDVAASVPEQQEPQQMTMGPIYKAIGDYFSPSKRRDQSQQNQQLMAQAQQANQQRETLGKNPYQGMSYEDFSRKQGIEPSPPLGKNIYQGMDYEDFAHQQEQRQQAKQAGLPLEEFQQQRDQDLQTQQEEFRKQIDEAMNEPYARTVWGLADIVRNSPELKEDVKAFIPEFSDEQLEKVSAVEALLEGMSEEQMKNIGLWDEQIAATKQRIESNQANDVDKYLIGMALLMPLIIGGIFGKDAAVGAMAGSASGIADIFTEREKSIQKDTDRLADLTQQRGESQLAKSKIDLEKLKSKDFAGDPPLAHLKGKQKITIEGPQGKVEGYKLAPDLYAREEYLTDKEDVTRMNKKADELAEAKTAVDQLSMNTRKVLQIADQVKDKGKFQKLLMMGADKLTPSAIDDFGEEVILDGKKVNSAVAMRQIKEQLVQTRRDAEKIKNFSPILFSHMDNIISNPYTTFTSWENAKDQMLRLYTSTRDVFLKDAENKGFLIEPLLKEFAKDDKKMYGALDLVEGAKREGKKDVKRQTKMVEVPDGESK